MPARFMLAQYSPRQSVMTGFGVGGQGVGGTDVGGAYVGGTHVEGPGGTVMTGGRVGWGGCCVHTGGGCVGITTVGSTTGGFAVGEPGRSVGTGVGETGSGLSTVNSAAARWPVPGSMTVTSARGIRAQRGS